jgi:hypothetical protein
MAATEIVAVLDAGPLIHLDELGRLNLLNDFKELLVPQTVLDEALKHRPGLELGGLENLEIISEPPPLPADLLKLADELALHAGGWFSAARDDWFDSPCAPARQGFQSRDVAVAPAIAHADNAASAQGIIGFNTRHGCR